MNANRYGDLVGGQGSAHHFLKLVGQPAYSIPGIDGGMWLDDDAFISRMGNNLVLFSRHDGFALPDLLDDAGNVWACGGGNYATTLLKVGGYASWGKFTGGLPDKYRRDWAIMDASRDGALLWALNGQYEVLWPDGTIQAVGEAFECRLSWEGGSAVLLMPGSVRIAFKTGAVLQVPLVAGSMALNKPALDFPYVSYATNDARYVYNSGDATAGWVTTPVYAPELYGTIFKFHEAGSLGPAELPSEVVIDLLDRPMIALPPVTPPDPPDPPDPPEPPMPQLTVIGLRVPAGTSGELLVAEINDAAPRPVTVRTSTMSAWTRWIPYVLDAAKWQDGARAILEAEQAPGWFLAADPSGNAILSQSPVVWLIHANPVGWALTDPLNGTLTCEFGSPSGADHRKPVHVLKADDPRAHPFSAWNVWEPLDKNGKVIVGPFK